MPNPAQSQVSDWGVTPSPPPLRHYANALCEPVQSMHWQQVQPQIPHTKPQSAYPKIAQFDGATNPHQMVAPYLAVLPVHAHIQAESNQVAWTTPAQISQKSAPNFLMPNANAQAKPLADLEAIAATSLNNDIASLAQEHGLKYPANHTDKPFSQ